MSGGCVADAFICKVCILKHGADSSCWQGGGWPVLDSEAPRPGVSASNEKGEDPGQ